MLIINAIPIKSGGGLQKALALLSELSEQVEDTECVWIVDGAGALGAAARARGVKTISVRPGYIGRLIAELTIPRRLGRDSVCLNLGGAPMLLSLRSWINVSECAYSNLLYPEIDFWKWESKPRRIIKSTVDIVRISLVSFSDILLFQTPAMLSRARLGKLVCDDTAFLSVPSPSRLVRPGLADSKTTQDFRARWRGRSALLFACGEQKNKRLHLLPKLAKSFADDLDCSVVFVITIPGTSRTAEDLRREAAEEGVSECIEFIGPVRGPKYSALLNSIDVVCNFAVLESFSNNFVEAWRFEKPLVVTDADWSRSVAYDGALYVNPECITETSCKLKRLLHSPKLRRDLTTAGAIVLRRFPTPAEKTKNYVRLLTRCSKKASLVERLTRTVRWLRLYLGGRYGV